ncbi:MAG: response regulator transcription factor [Rhodothermales bacterium]|nr:response regulator transcription factor [Rhodothermales bacterium]MBO6778169.1 response regulator transcription factor [Rhodothermales bacterium]
MPIRVLIADDHAIVRRGVIQIFSEEPDMVLVGEADTGNGAIDLAREHEADIFILDLNMPGPGGLAVLSQLRAEHPKLPILVLTMHDEEQYGVRILKAGAAGFLAKNSAPDKLVEAIRHIIRGRRYVSAALAEALLEHMESPAPEAPHESLSDREFQVFQELARGNTPSGIADKLSLSVKTISTYRSRVLAKLNLSSNAEIVRYALENDIIV